MASLRGTTSSFALALSLAGLLAFLGHAQQLRQLDPGRSRLSVHVGKAGLFSAFGHEHQIDAPILSGTLQSQHSVELQVDARQLKVADLDVSDQERAEIQRTMLGSQVLDADRYPEIRFRSTAIDPAGKAEWRVRGELTLHGQTHPILVAVKEENGRYFGSSSFKQTAFGIKPVSAAGGSVKVKDEVTVRFEIALR